PQSQVAITSQWREDLYIALAGWDDFGALTALQIKINPLVLWLWIGSIILGLGTLYCVLPPLLPLIRRVLAAAPCGTARATTGIAAGPTLKAAAALSTAHLDTRGSP